MDIARLKQYIALAETLHFTEASRRCHVSPSTLSRTISQLEAEIDAALFVRDNRSVSMTDAGKTFLVFARETLAQWQAVKLACVEEQGQLKGALNFYCSVTASYSFLYNILANFRQQHPKVEIRLHTGDPALAIERVLSGQEDFSIAARAEIMPKEVRFKRLTFSPLVLIQPTRETDWLPAPRTTDFWQRIPFILSEKGVTRQRIETWFKRERITPYIYAQVAGHEAIVSMVSLGFGVGLIPKIVLDNSPLADKVIAADKQPRFAPYEVGICVLEKRLKHPIIKAFWEQSFVESDG